MTDHQPVAGLPHLSSQYLRLVDYALVVGIDLAALSPTAGFSGSSGAPAAATATATAGAAPVGSDAPSQVLDVSQLQPKLLSQYPAASPSATTFDEPAVVMFCFPNGFHPVSLSQSAPKRLSDASPRFHSFVMTQEEGTRIYGSCLVVYQDKVSLRAASKASGENHVTQALLPTALCLLSHVPCIASHKEYLLQMLDVAAKGTAFPLESYLYNLIVDVPTPIPGTTIFVSAPKSVPFPCPAFSDLPLLGYSMKPMFERLSVPSIIKLFMCAMLERRIIVRSSDLELLALVLESISALMFPFTWCHVYVPVMSAQLMHFIEAPVPYMMGAHTDVLTDDMLPSFDEVVFVDLDLGAVFCPDWLPQLPEYRKLVDTIHKVVDSNAAGASTSASGDPSASHAPMPSNSIKTQIFSSPNLEQVKESVGEEQPASTGSSLLTPASSSMQRSLSIPDGTAIPSSSGTASSAALQDVYGGPDTHAAANPDTSTLASRRKSVVLVSRSSAPSILPFDDISTGKEGSQAVSPSITVSDDTGGALQQKASASSASISSSQPSTPQVSFQTLTALSASHPSSPAASAPLHHPLLPSPSPSSTATPSKRRTSTKPATVCLDDEFPTQAIRWAFLDFLVAVFLEYESFLIGKGKRGWQPEDVADAIKNFDKIAFLSDQSPDAAAFFTMFLDTQTFANYLSAKMANLARQTAMQRTQEQLVAFKASSAGTEGERATQHALEVELAALQSEHKSSSEIAADFFDERITVKRSSLGFLQTPSFRARRSASVSVYSKRVDHQSVSVAETWASIQKQAALPESDAFRALSPALSEAPRRTSIAVDAHSQSHSQSHSHAKHTASLTFRPRSFSAINFGWLPTNPQFASVLERAYTLARHGTGHESTSLLLSAPKPTSRGRSVSVLRKGTSERELADPASGHAVFFDQTIQECETIVGRIVNICREDSAARHEVLRAHLSQRQEAASSGAASPALTGVSLQLKYQNDAARSASKHELDMLITKLCEAIEHVWAHGVTVHEGKSAFWSHLSQCDMPSSSEASKNRDRVFRIMLKTDVGWGRCFIRLAIERRTLKQCLETALVDTKTVKRLYKDYAFLNTSSHISRFLEKLAPLSSVHVRCFTNKNYINSDTGYSLVIHTGDFFRAGTSASVFVAIHGSKSSTPRITISAAKAFQRGRVDEFIIQVADLGIIDAVQVGHDNSGFHPGWFLSKVTLEHCCTGKVYAFECNRWLATSEDDGLIVRALFEKGNGGSQPSEPPPAAPLSSTKSNMTPPVTPSEPGAASGDESSPPSDAPAPSVTRSNSTSLLPKILQMRKTGGHVRTPSGTFLGMFLGGLSDSSSASSSPSPNTNAN